MQQQQLPCVNMRGPVSPRCQVWAGGALHTALLRAQPNELG